MDKIFYHSRHHVLTLWVCLYVGLMLNFPTFLLNVEQGDLLLWLTGALSLLSSVLLTFLLLIPFVLISRKLYRLLLSVVVAISAFAAYFMIFNDVVIGYAVVASTFHTDAELAKEVLGWKLIVWVALSAIIPVILIWRYHLPVFFSRNHLLVPWLFNSLVISVVFVCLYGTVMGVKSINEYKSARDNLYIPSPGGTIAHSYLPANWIVGLAMYIRHTYAEKSLNELLNPVTAFGYNQSAVNDDLTVVFVLGETTRSDNLGILGYSRATTPELSKTDNLVAIAGRSCDTATITSMRCMFVRPEGVADNKPRTLHERNVFSVLAQTDFPIEIISLQSEDWFYRTTGAKDFMIREELVSKHHAHGRAVTDQLLVDELTKRLQDNNEKKRLIILHTKGSHYLYSQRYPRAFARYLPECLDIDQACSKEELINAYDNSILFIDHYLSQIYTLLSDRNALVVYISDHGETIEENQHFHATPRDIAPDEQFRIPAIFWASEKFLSDTENRLRFEALEHQASTGRLFHHSEIFDTLLGCIGYQSSGGGINDARNWCTPPGNMREPVKKY